MRKRSYLYILLLIVLVLSGFIFFKSYLNNSELLDKTDNSKILLNLDLSKKYQTMHSFGASDAWRCQFVGKNWPDEKKQKMAEWLFSQEFDERGNPKGIGLSIWRFYIGAGSMEQGEVSGINHPWRRVECFQDSNGNYNWEKQKGQQWFLNKAKEYGVEYTLAFTVSPPVHMTTNNKAFGPKGKKNLNILPGKEKGYAKFLVDVCEHFDSISLAFDYLSPFNEPQWDWNGPSQEGTPAVNKELFQFIESIDIEATSRNINVKQVIGEAADIGFMIETREKYEEQSNIISAFLDKQSEYYIGNLSTVEPVISAHSYFTTWPLKAQLKYRIQLREKLDSVNPEFNYWQSEYCILEQNDEIIGGGTRDLGMGTALYVARVIHNDLTIANASSWQWWTAISQCDYKDGLIYLDNGNNGITDQSHPDNIKLMYDGNFHDSKLLWALGNFSRFIRPGMKRIELQANSNQQSISNQILTSGYINEETYELVVVIINLSETECFIGFEEFKQIENQFKCYTTSKDKNMEFSKVKNQNIRVEPRSIMTCITNINI